MKKNLLKVKNEIVIFLLVMINSSHVSASVGALNFMESKGMGGSLVVFILIVIAIVLSNKK